MIIGSKLLFIENLPSTNTHATTLLRISRPEEGLVISTNFQPAGRGQGSNTWESEADKNLLISIIVYPTNISPERQFLLSTAISLGICDFLGRYTTDISVKWPNDIYVKNDKIAGILIENSILGNKIEHSVAGIGLNINQELFTGGAPNPVSLKNLTGTDYDTGKCLEELLRDLDGRYKSLITGETDKLETDYSRLLYRKDEWHRYCDDKGEFNGMITGVSPEGLLLIRRENGALERYAFREVDFMPDLRSSL
jgi:BirA family transcriptional regulator, biotin operon repressor / biotin---[acetyl-CoA-carboxylase] ligase